MKAARCGRPSGYSAHQKRGEKPCDACARAKSEYDKRWRVATGRAQRSRLNAKAQSRALRRLKDEHVEVYHAYYAEELGRVYREAGLL